VIYLIFHINILVAKNDILNTLIRINVYTNYLLFVLTTFHVHFCITYLDR